MKASLNETIIILISIIAMVAFIMIMINILSKSSTTETINTEIVDTNPLDLEDSFKYDSYLFDENAISFSDYDECENLKTAIKNAIITGKPYRIDRISYKQNPQDNMDFPFIGDCAEEDIEIEIAEGLNQVVCRFEPIEENEIVGIEDYGGISDTSYLYFDDCRYVYNSNNILPFFSDKGVIGRIVEINPESRKINVLYSTDHMELENGDYSHFWDGSRSRYLSGWQLLNALSSITNENAFYNAYSKEGMLNMYVGSAESVNGICKFNVYMCPRPALAENDDQSSIGIFNIFRKLDINPFELPYYIQDFSEKASTMPGYSKEVYYWNYHEIDLDQDYDVETIINAIKEGLYFNVKTKGYTFAHPHWDVQKISDVYTRDDKVIIDIAIIQGSGEVCVKVEEKPDQCTTSSIVAKLDVGDYATFEFNGDLVRTETNLGTINQDFSKEIEDADGFMKVYFEGEEDDMLKYTFGVAQGSGSVTVRRHIYMNSIPAPLAIVSDSLTLELAENQQVDVFAVPDEGFYFDRFEYRGRETIDSESFTLTADSDGSFIDAVFKPTNGVLMDQECWRSEYNEIINSGSEWDRTRSIRFYCGDDNICSGKLGIKVAIRKDIKPGDINSDGKLEDINYISGIMSFCEA
ncbi:MAG: hypothetical protein JW700_02275 [Candidatus Aenigmarchaeota archaeon]|nr:hypothetical protein [Candidatus Aenigmarchaeota archaeon]